MFGGKKRLAIRKLRSDNLLERTAALEFIREQGWLTDGSLKGIVLNRADLHGLSFINARMKGASLVDANLKGCDFSRADLSGAILIGADLCGARLVDAVLAKADCESAWFDEADLTNAVLDGAFMVEASLQNTRVTDGQLARVEALAGATVMDGSRYDGRYRLAGDIRRLVKEAGIPYPGEMYVNVRDSAVAADWYGVDLEAYERGQAWADTHLTALLRKESAKEAQIGTLLRNLRETRDPDHVHGLLANARDRGWLKDGSLRGGDFTGAVLREAYLYEADLRGADFRGADLAGADLSGSDLREARFEGAILDGTNLGNCLMQGIDLSGQDLYRLGVEWRKFDLSRAKLRGASLRGLDLTFTNLYEADLPGADMTGTLLDMTNLSATNLEGCRVSAEELVWASMPTGATMPDGSRYDGRFNLEGDLDEAEKNGIDPDIDEQMAHWYDVPVEEYLRGQDWSDEHLDGLRGDP